MMPTLAITTNTITRPAASPPDTPAWARLARAASESARFFGFAAASRTARPPVSTGVSVSIADIHFGLSTASLAADLFRQSRNARSTRRIPPTSLSQYDVSDALPLLPTSPASARRQMPVLTRATPTSHPAVKTSPFTPRPGGQQHHDHGDDGQPADRHADRAGT